MHFWLAVQRGEQKRHQIGLLGHSHPRKAHCYVDDGKVLKGDGEGISIAFMLKNKTMTHHRVGGLCLHVEFQNRFDRHLDHRTGFQPLVDVRQHLHHLQANSFMRRRDLLQDRRQEFKDVPLQLLERRGIVLG